LVNILLPPIVPHANDSLERIIDPQLQEIQSRRIANLKMVMNSDDLLDSVYLARSSEGNLEWRPAVADPAVIQQRLLPCDVPAFEGVECSAMCRQAEAVGGDFYDFLPLPNGELGIAIGDICGKGLGAALMMANLQATLRAEVRHVPADLPAFMASANRSFHEASLEGLYSTLVYATFDPVTRVVKYVNAGHPPPMVVRQERSKLEWLDRGGTPVGMFHHCTYEVGSIVLNPCDVIVAYTDGVVESLNPSGEHWGVERLVRIVKASEKRTPIKLTVEIMDAVDAFSHGTEQRDDMALVVLRAI
jgi:phosphoserine phosphatase RsbU/P